MTYSSNGHDRHGENTQALAKIQHSRADDDNPPPRPDGKAAIVADPRNRLTEGVVDPVTKERKPARD